MQHMPLTTPLLATVSLQGSLMFVFLKRVQQRLGMNSLPELDRNRQPHASVALSHGDSARRYSCGMLANRTLTHWTVAIC